MELALQCGIELEVINSSLHFIEKIVPPFEQLKMPTVEELKQLVDVHDDSGDRVERSEDVNDYIHRKIPCKVKLDRFKEQYYDSIRSSAIESSELGTDFMFTEVLPNGKLAIPTDDSEDEEKDVDMDINKQSRLLDKRFCDKYNLCLSLAEKESTHKPNLIKRLFLKKRKLQFARNAAGQFVKGGTVSVEVGETNDDPSETKEVLYTSTQMSAIGETGTELENIDKFFSSESIDINNLNLSDIDIEAEFPDLDDYLNLSEISLFGENNAPITNESKKNIVTGKHTFFMPFKDYWMYHCNFSRVKSKNFALFEKALPRSFRWLLNECALMAEMTPEDLYEEVCLIEAYHAHVFKSDSKNDEAKSISKNQVNLILNKW